MIFKTEAEKRKKRLKKATLEYLIDEWKSGVSLDIVLDLEHEEKVVEYLEKKMD